MSDQHKVSAAEIAALESCQENVLAKPYPTDGELYCNRTWDGWGCWPDTVAGGRAYIHCPGHRTGFDVNLQAHKDCTINGTWWKSPVTNLPWANYTGCINLGELESGKRMINIFIVGYSVSIAALVVSLVIFCNFRQLQCDRVTLHKNLFLSYILNGMAWILYYQHAAIKSTVLQDNSLWCQVLHVVTQYFVACNYFWMFCEGLYLHTIIVFAFVKGKHLLVICLVTGWCSPLLTTAIYAIARPLLTPESTIQCWMNDHPMQWIVLGPVIVTILLNLVFLCNIVRVLVTKMRAVNSPDTNQTRKAVRATLILIPLLGLQYLLMPFQPEDGTQLYEIYLHANAILSSSQGFFVAVIFCFCNGEVISVIRRKWGQHRLMFGAEGQGRGRSRRHSSCFTSATVAEHNNTCSKSKDSTSSKDSSKSKQNNKNKYNMTGDDLSDMKQTLMPNNDESKDMNSVV